MKTQEPSPNLVDLNQLRLTGTRTVEVKVRDLLIQVTESLEEDPTVEREIARAQMKASQDAAKGAALDARLKALPDGASSERDAIEAEVEAMSSGIDRLGTSVLFNPRRIVCQRISRRFVSWNVNLPLDFDSLFDSSLSTATLQEILGAVVSEPILGE